MTEINQINRFELSSINFDRNNADKSIKYLINIVLPEWNCDEIIFKELTGGVTNSLYQIKHGNEKLLMRVYGYGTHIFLDRVSEIEKINILHQNHLAAGIIGTFCNGMIYQYQEGRPLSPMDLKNEKLSKLIAEEMARFHLADMTSLSKKIDNYGLTSTFEMMYKLVNILTEVIFERKIHGWSSHMELVKEIDLLSKFLENDHSELVFCHNDLLSNNIIYSEEKNKMNFIDFEYSGFNYPEFDIANHFVEFAGLETVDYSQLPSNKFQIRFIRDYVTCRRRIEKTKRFQNDNKNMNNDENNHMNNGENKKVNGVTSSIMNGKGNHKHNQENGDSEENQDDIEKETLKILNRIKKFMLASHLLWIIWSFTQSLYSSIDFDYVKYAKIRTTEYRNLTELYGKELYGADEN
ncbi:hypothetical protein SNEBB_007141 [Seison nebaliae]|nr:hypothetical protein SNEBB_007141 [Seison nebaliae]